MRKYLVIIEKGEEGYGAYSPDLPGCVAVGLTREETEQKMYEAISFHLEGLHEEGLPFPENENYAEYLVLPDNVR
jgi:predicted RNase H-like HicB family nuclease